MVIGEISKYKELDLLDGMLIAFSIHGLGVVHSWTRRRGGLCEIAGDGKLWYPLAIKEYVGGDRNLA